ncbi:MAG TPA: RdgB/HAM1 family non-canonical purine NTP pyrophosphatase [Thermomicrobiales bacterium]|nr:RdgB/HAM1 family non-canonical purine NTP pyrophosphatase [Thermomicrobiales bacterium]
MSLEPRLVLASNNPGKIREFRDLLKGQVEIVSLMDLGIESPQETEPTFLGNAAIKARSLHDLSGEVTLADDSGLIVDALDGRPGVLSARYAGDHGDDAANRAMLLEQMNTIPPVERTARFVAAIVVIDRTGGMSSVEGICEGSIGFEERGSNGFGYDSLFVLPTGRTMAELTSAEKSLVSHRGEATRRILPYVQAALGLHLDST